MRILPRTLCLSLTSIGAYRQQAESAAGEKPCQIVRTGVTMVCPAGWAILVENEDEAVVANFRLGSGVTKNTRSGHGKATIAVSKMPRLYGTFSEWIYAAHKNAPEADGAWTETVLYSFPALIYGYMPGRLVMGPNGVLYGNRGKRGW